MTKQKNPESSELKAQNPQQPPEPDPALRCLDVFVGKWNTEGQLRATPSSPAIKIIGTDTYEWLTGGFFLVHRVDVRMGDEEVKSVEIIGYDDSSQTYPMHSFDNKGSYDLLQASVHDGTWIITGKSIRFTGAFSDDGNIIMGNWELLTDGSNWSPWMEVKLTRVEDLMAHPFDTGSTTQKRETKPARPDRDASGSYASVNGLNMYYEIHGTGRPLILLHGGVGASDMFGPVLPMLAENRQVIAVHLQAHGRTADINRPLRFELLADDIAALMKYLDIEKADIMGYSLGAGVALQTAIRHPDLVRKLVIISAPVKQNGWYPEVQELMAQMGPETAKAMKQTTLYQLYPDTDWEALFTRLGDLVRQDYDWSKEVAAISSPIMIAFGDADAIRIDHITEFFALFGGGQRDAGLDGSQRPTAQLAILPGVTHYNILSFPSLAAVVTEFLDSHMPEVE
jgi:pimeloyl-ACP methyl ester carboxylesterase